MRNRLQHITVHYAGGRHHGSPCCRPHWRHMCHAQAFFGKHMLAFVEVCCRFVFLLAQHMQPLTLFLSGLSTKGHRKEDPSFYYAQSLGNVAQCIMRVGDTMVIHVVDRIDGTCAMPRHSLANICLCLLRCVAGLFVLLAQHMQPLTLFLSGLSTKGHRREDPSFYYAQSLAT